MTLHQESVTLFPGQRQAETLACMPLERLANEAVTATSGLPLNGFATHLCPARYRNHGKIAKTCTTAWSDGVGAGLPSYGWRLRLRCGAPCLRCAHRQRRHCANARTAFGITCRCRPDGCHKINQLSPRPFKLFAGRSFRAHDLEAGHRNDRHYSIPPFTRSFVKCDG